MFAQRLARRTARICHFFFFERFRAMFTLRRRLHAMPLCHCHVSLERSLPRRDTMDTMSHRRCRAMNYIDVVVRRLPYDADKARVITLIRRHYVNHVC